MLLVEKVGKTYPNGTVALENVNLAIAPGEIVALVGGSGCGKSTLLRLIGGLDQTSRGHIRVDDAPVTAPVQNVGLVFQEPRLLPWLTVAQNIAFGIQDLPRMERDARVRKLLADIRLPDYGNRWPKELSGGQAQRVAIARALAPEPEILLLDEPFSALDAFTRSELQDHLIDLWQKHRRSFVIVTHDIEEAVALAHRIVIMRPHPGRIAEELPLEIAHPRDRTSEAFVNTERHIRKKLESVILHTV